MEKVILNLVTDFGDEPGVCFSTEASAIGLCPGVWPTKLVTDLGDEKDFELQGMVATDVFLYRQPSTGIELHVLND